MPDTKPTLGSAIDRVVEALTPFEERDRETILATVSMHLGMRERTASELTRADLKPSVEAKDSNGRSRAETTRIATGTDIRTLKGQKQPNSARQMACLVAYYLQELAPVDEQKNSITTADLEKYFKQANYKLPTKLEQLLVDCKRSGYFESSARGEYKLTRVGYNLVTHSMPGKSVE